MAEMSSTRCKQVILLKNCLPDIDSNPLKHKLGKGDWAKILERINTKITKKWKMFQETQYSFSITIEKHATITIEKEDAKKLESVLSKHTHSPTSPITLNIISPPIAITDKTDDQEKKKEKHTLLFRYVDDGDDQENQEKQWEYKLDKGFDSDDEILFLTIMKAVQTHFKISQFFLIDGDECEILSMDDIQSGLDEIDPLLLHLRPKPTPNQKTETEHTYPELNDTAKPLPVIKLMKECKNDQVRNMVAFDDKIRTQIHQKYRSAVRKRDIKSEQLYRVLEGLNTARPRVEEDYDKLPTEFQDVITFWQRYAHLCLIQLNVETCINARVAIDAELFETDAFEGSEAFENHKETICEIIRNYHELTQNADPNEFEVLLTLIKSIEIEIKPEQRPMDPDTLLNEDAFVIANEAVTPKQGKKDDQCRVYLYLEQFATAAYVEFTTLYEGFHRMNPVAPNTHLFYIDFDVPWRQGSTKMKFAYENQHQNRISIDTKTKLHKGKRGYYWIETTSSSWRPAWLWSRLQNDNQNQKTKPEHEILHHIVHQIDNTYESYHFALQIIDAFKKSLKQEHHYLDQLWQQQLTQVQKKHQMIDVFKLQLLQSICEHRMTVDAIYHVIKTCFMDRKFSFTRNRRQQTIIGQAIYDSFINAVRTLFRNDVRTRNVSSKDYVLLHPIYHFFHYFEALKVPRVWDTLVFNNRNKYDDVFTRDVSWTTLPIQGVLRLDLQIASCNPIKIRQYPLECLVIQLCSIRRATIGIKLFRETLESISALQKGTLQVYDAMFAQQSCVADVFDILGHDFDLWQELIASIQPQVISRERNILNAFQTCLRQQIERMNGDDVKFIQHLNGLIMLFPQIFDVVPIRCALLKNDKLTQCANKKQLETNLKVIITMTTRGDFFKEMNSWKVVGHQLIKWMRKLLLAVHTKDTALSVLGQAFLTKDERKVSIFRRTFTESLATKKTVFDRLLIYLDCPSFYDLEAIHSHFIHEQLLRDEDDPKIAHWSNAQKKEIQHLCTKFTTDNETMDKAIKLWSAIFDKLIRLPEKQDMMEDDDDANPMDPFLISELEYCLSMREWIQYAVGMTHIEPLGQLVVFVEKVLHTLNGCIASDSITVECLSLLCTSRNKVQNLIKLCGLQEQIDYKGMVKRT
eukprot:27532_1